MEYLVLYFVGVLIMLAIQYMVRHKYKQYYKFAVYMTLVVSGAYKFANYLAGSTSFVYVFCLTLTMALLAAFITRTSLVIKAAGTK